MISRDLVHPVFGALLVLSMQFMPNGVAGAVLAWRSIPSTTRPRLVVLLLNMTRILYVDDDEDWAETVRSELLRRGAHDVSFIPMRAVGSSILSQLSAI
jgi:hypothetical protein